MFNSIAVLEKTTDEVYLTGLARYGDEKVIQPSVSMVICPALKEPEAKLMLLRS